MRIEPKGKLAELLRNAGRHDLASGFDVDDDFHVIHAAQVTASHPELDEEALETLTGYSAALHPNAPHNQKPVASTSEPVPAIADEPRYMPVAGPISVPVPAAPSQLVHWIQVLLLIALLLATCFKAKAQTTTAPVATASTVNSALTSYITSAASTNATSVKASPGNVYTIRAVNTTGTLYYLRMYNLATSPTCSSATGFVETIPVPASTTGAGLVITQYPQGYTTGIAYCLTGGGSSTDNTNAATGVYITVLYK